MAKPLTYRECKTPEDFARFDAELRAEDEALNRAAEYDRKREEEWWAAHPNGPTEEDEAAAEEAAYLAELNRGYARDRR